MPDREKVIKDLDELYRLIYQSNVDGEILGSLHDAVALLKEQPQIVRCKDCKHYIYARNDAAGYCTKDSSCWVFRDLDWFCADGVKRDGE